MTFTEPQRELRREHRARMDAARLLVDLEEAGFHGDLPVLDWQIAGHGLIGRPTPFGSPAEKRAAFDAWCDHLGMDPEPPGERIHPTRGDVLRAQTRVPHPQASTGTVRVILTAEIDMEDTDQ